MNAQLPLVWRWPARQRLASFVAGPNAVALDLVTRVAAGDDRTWLFLAGPSGSGRSHLLVAACAAAQAEGRSAQYLPLARLGDDGVEAIRGCGGSDLLALDDFDAIAGHPAAEHALFDLYNRCRAEQTVLLFAASAPPTQLGIGLPDLESRLSACTQVVLKPLDEVERRSLVRDRARERGIELDEAALDWLFTRRKRDLATLFDLLERIDRAALAAKRRVTVPFLRSLVD
ncbi:DnaA regulatory inactivator Hda [Dokdonella sp.]|uniref:DnaA regulatory inactivator Hda n=1 Tax=Dokdonella sp. TaxID=2291710 RepID=UPI0025C2E9A6|nr:DnaA regulatory inactivator Hda [Dokdonella sp.]MBX3689976.1 DnaA regulatory inactivator Hda [Dokdonella sp.]